MNFGESPIWTRQIEKKENLYERVEQKAQAILDFRKLIEESGDRSVEELTSKLEVELSDVKNRIGVEKTRQYALLLEKEKDLSGIDNRLEEIHDELYPEIWDDEEDAANLDTDDEDDFEIMGVANEELEQEQEELYDQQQELIEEIEKLREDDDVMFIAKLDNFSKNSIKKRRETLNLLNHIEKDGSYVQSSILNGYELEDGYEIQSSGFCVNIILSPKDYSSAIGQESNGVHLHNQAINIVMHKPGMEDTIRHEENHNISESFVPRGLYITNLVSRLKKEIKRSDELQGLDAPEHIIEYGELRIQKMIADYYKCNHSEIIADIDRLPTGNMNTFLHNYNQAEEELSNFAKGIENKELGEKMLQKIDEMEKKFIKYFYDLSNIFYVANRIGKTEEAKALMILFGNGNGIRRIERHLRNYDSRYADLVLLRRFTGEMDYTKNLERRNLTGMDLLQLIFGDNYDRENTRVSLEFGLPFDDLESLKRIEILSASVVDAQQKEVIASRMDVMIDAFMTYKNYDFEKNKIDVYMEIINSLKRIGENCGVQSKNIGSYKYGLFSNYVQYVFKRKKIAELENRYAYDFSEFFGVERMKGIIMEELEFDRKVYYKKNGELRSSVIRTFLEKLDISF
ncbi:MAG: hypothetical protein WC823_03875 [Parcubacteria group bacterium]|jgi:hypothetical protein